MRLFDVRQSDGDSGLCASQENGDVANVEEDLRVIKKDMAEVRHTRSILAFKELSAVAGIAVELAIVSDVISEKRVNSLTCILELRELSTQSRDGIFR